MNQLSTPNLGPLLNELKVAEHQLAEDNETEAQERHADEDFDAAEAREPAPRPSLVARLRELLRMSSR